jgi:hypothetical protein
MIAGCMKTDHWLFVLICWTTSDFTGFLILSFVVLMYSFWHDLVFVFSASFCCCKCMLLLSAMWEFCCQLLFWREGAFSSKLYNFLILRDTRKCDRKKWVQRVEVWYVLCVALASVAMGFFAVAIGFLLKLHKEVAGGLCCKTYMHRKWIY